MSVRHALPIVDAPALILVESNTTPTGQQFARAARELGLWPVILAKDPSKYAFIAEDEISAMQLDTMDDSAVLHGCRSIAERVSVAGVTSSSEYFAAAAARVAQALGLAAPSPTAIENCRNKEIQRRILRMSQLLVPTSFAVSEIGAAIAAARSCHLPVVAKPIDGSGSVGVKLCRTEQEVAAHATVLLSATQNERGLPAPQRLMIEQFVDGREYSVEVFDGVAVGITAKHLGGLPSFIEIGHDFPAPLSEPEAGTARRVAETAVVCLGLTVGPAHVELRLSGQDATIIEVNPRLAGGGIPDLLRIAWGIDLVKATVAAAAGRQPELVPRRHAAASIRFLIPSGSGEIKRIEGLAQAQRMAGVAEATVTVAAGELFIAHGDFRDRVGRVVARAREPGASAQLAERALAQLSVEIEAHTSLEPHPSRAR